MVRMGSSYFALLCSNRPASCKVSDRFKSAVLFYYTNRLKAVLLVPQLPSALLSLHNTITLFLIIYPH